MLRYVACSNEILSRGGTIQKSNSFKKLENMFRTILIFLLLSIAPNLFAQQGIIKGVVTDLSNNKPLSFATIVVQGQEVGAYTDDNGAYTITLPIGLYNITCSNVGYISKTINEVEVKQSKPANINISLEPATRELQNVVIEASKFSFDKNNKNLYTYIVLVKM